MIRGRMKKIHRTTGSEYRVSTTFPSAVRRTACGSIPIAVQSPETKPRPMTNCQMYVFDLFAMRIPYFSKAYCKKKISRSHDGICINIQFIQKRHQPCYVLHRFSLPGLLCFSDSHDLNHERKHTQ